jgi:hypothetical protein
MGIKNLKKENDHLNMTLIDMLAKFDPSKTKKNTQFLVKMLNKRLDNQIAEWDYSHNPVPVKFRDYFQNTPADHLSFHIIAEYFLPSSYLSDFIELCKLMEKGLVKNNDIGTYDSWEMVQENLFEAKNREYVNKAKKEINIIYSDDTYLILKPLTYMASCHYGAQTKWCTAARDTPEPFYSYSRDGILIYLINKKDNTKFAFYKRVESIDDIIEPISKKVFTTYSADDKEIDTIQTGLPMDILKVILNETNTESQILSPNYVLFSETEMEEMLKYVFMSKLNPEPKLRVVRRNFDTLTDLRTTMPTPDLIETFCNEFTIHQTNLD